MKNTARRFGHISVVAGDHMYMQVRNSLASCNPGIESYIVAVGLRLEPLIQESPHIADQRHHVCLFGV